jgi:hypothetical protein
LALKSFRVKAGHKLPDGFGENIEVRNQPFRNSESSTMKPIKSLWAGLCVILAFLAVPAAAALPKAFQIDDLTAIDFKMDRIQIFKIEETNKKLSPTEAIEQLEKSGKIATKEPWYASNRIYWQYLRVENTKSDGFALRIYYQGFDRPEIYLQRQGAGFVPLKFKTPYSYNFLAESDAENDGSAKVESRYMTVNIPAGELIGILVRVKNDAYLGDSLGLGEHSKLLGTR